MATKPRSTRRLGKSKTPHKGKRPPAKKPVKKAAPKRAAGKPRRKPVESSRGMVETALAGFAHEVRTPLTGILAISSLLEASDLGARERRWVETIRTGAEHLAALATLYVDAAKSMTTQLPMREDFFDLRALARSAGDGLTGRATANGLQSKVTIADSLPVFVTGDAVRLRAAVENLVDNAVKILSVEDNPVGRVVLNTVLGELGHKIEFVGQGELAPERVTRGDFDVVLMDMVLPGIDGVETIRRLRALGAVGERIGFIGVFGREQDEAKARAAGADALLKKPVRPRALAAALGAAPVRKAASGECSPR